MDSNIDKRIVVITESSFKMLQDEFSMTQYKFNSALKRFLHDILVDPINAQVPTIFKFNGLNRSKLIKYLIDYDLLRKEQKIHDSDEYGNPVTATMKVKYNVPKNNFDRKLKKLYIKLFEKNVPQISKEELTTEENIDETTSCGGGGFDAMGGNGANGGAYNTPVFGNDNKVLRRGDGKGGSNSIYNIG